MERWSYAMYDLGVSTDEFWDMTPGELGYLEERHQNRRREAWLAVGEVCAMVVNGSINRPKKSVKPADFMPKDLR